MFLNPLTLETVNVEHAAHQLSINKSRGAIKARTESELSKYALRIISLISLLLKEFPKKEFILLKMKYIEGYIGVHGSKTREAILKALQQLSETKYTFYNRGQFVGKYSYLLDYTYDKENAEVTLRLDLSAVDFLFDLKGGYAKLMWIYTFGMKSKYGQKLYELVVLESYRVDKTMLLTINDLKNMLGLQNKYNKKNDFINNVIRPGLNDINQCTPYNLSYTEYDKKFYFVITEKTKEEVEVLTENLKNNKQIKEIIISYNEILVQSETKITQEDYINTKNAAINTATEISSSIESKQFELSAEEQKLIETNED